MDVFLRSIKRKYKEKRIIREKQWPPRSGKKLIKLQLLRDIVGQQQAPQVQINEYSDLFLPSSDDDIMRKVVIVGDAGLGKTMLCTDISIDWADGKVFNQFELLLLLPLRDKRITSAESLPELIKLLHNSKAVCKTVADSLEESEGENMLIMADGWDELDETHRSEESFIYNLLFGDVLPFASVLLTSRPLASESLKHNPCVDHLVKLVGFNTENVKEYILSEFSSDQEKGLCLLRQLNTNPLLQSICSIPLNCAIICHLWRSLEEDLPATMTELYTKVILQTLYRNISKIPEYSKTMSLPSFSAIPDSLKSQWIKICEFAFESLKKNQVVFSQSELQELLTTSNGSTSADMLQCFGLVQAIHSVLVDEAGYGLSLQFIHLTFQEYLAALYLVNQPVEVIITHCRRLVSLSRFSMVWRFFYGFAFNKAIQGQIEGMNVETQLTQCQKLVSLSANNMRLKSLFLCQCSFEAQSNLVTSLIARSLSRRFLVNVRQLSSKYDEATVVDMISNLQMCKYMNIDVDYCHLGDKGIAELGIVKSLASNSDKICLTTLNLSSNALTDKGILDLFSLARGPLQSLGTLILFHNKIGAQGMNAILNCSHNLEYLLLNNNPLEAAGIVELQRAIEEGSLKKLEWLALDETLCTDAQRNCTALCTLIKALCHCPQLFCVSLSKNSLGTEGARALGACLPQLATHEKIFQLHINETMLSDEGIRTLTENIQQVCHLRIFNIQGNEIHAEGAFHLANSVHRDLLRIKELNLDDNPLGLEGAVQVGRILTNVNSGIQYLTASNCHLAMASKEYEADSKQPVARDDLDVTQLFPSSVNESMTQLTLNGNNFSSNRVQVLGSLIQLCPNLTNLSTRDCNITSDDLRALCVHLAKVSAHFPKLEKWDLLGNDIDYHGVAVFSEYKDVLFPNISRLFCKPYYDEVQQALEKAIEERKVVPCEVETSKPVEITSTQQYQRKESSNQTKSSVSQTNNVIDNKDSLSEPQCGTSCVQEGNRHLDAYKGSLTTENLKSVQNELWECRIKWYNMGLELGVNSSTLDVIKEDNQTVDKCFTGVLKAWLKGVDPKPTWALMIEALNSSPVDFPHLSEKLKKKYVS